MEKTTLGLIAALGAAVVAPAAAHASAPGVDKILSPTSVAELLDPIPNARATMDAMNASGRTLEPVEVAQITIGPGGVRFGHHHHHHHHHHWRRRRHHHHHHHHHHF